MKDWDGRFVPAVVGVITGAALFGTTNISCGDVQSACAADCPEVSELETTVASLQDTVTMLQTKVDVLSNGLSQALAIERLSCAGGQSLQWSGTQWECGGVWIARIDRPDAATIKYTMPDGTMHSITVGAGTADVTGTHIAYRPGGAGDGRLYFNLAEAPSINCTLLNDEDDVPRIGRYMATDSGNGQNAIWGNTTTPTFVLAREGVPNFVLGVNESHSIACFTP